MNRDDTLANTFRTDFFPESPNCASSDPDLFFPEHKHSTKQIAQAKTFCLACVERVACRDYALKANEKDGVWGGLDEDERKTLRGRHKSLVETDSLDGLTPEQIASKNAISIEYAQQLLKELGRVPRGWMKGASDGKDD